uniref:Uncharacterized protein n=1 Tax=Meloidogyne enterolobii TaxID=390850 RepID=A0A6V7YAJ6_MELEN|nr:unnamed protein product [Meloidogyne enterolobii]CAD2208561.1 unnamed protein product [Meloidogyne enterolobii]
MRDNKDMNCRHFYFLCYFKLRVFGVHILLTCQMFSTYRYIWVLAHYFSFSYSHPYFTPNLLNFSNFSAIILKTEKFLKLTLSVSILIQLFLRWSFQHAKIEIIANDQGNCTAPSYVAFKDTERLIGDAAKNQVAMNPSNTVFDAKRLIGRKFDDPAVQSDMKHWPFKVIKEKVLVQKSKWKLKEK